MVIIVSIFINARKNLVAVKCFAQTLPASTLRNMHSPLIDSWRAYERHTFLLSTIQETLYHDQNTCLPIAGELWRSEQIGVMKELVARRKVSDEYRSLLDALLSVEGLDPRIHAEARWAKKESDRCLILTEAYIKRGAEVTALCEAAWARAKSNRDVSQFLPLLSQVVEHIREGAERLGYTASPYEVCLDDHQRGLSLSSVEDMCEDIRLRLAPLAQDMWNSSQ